VADWIIALAALGALAVSLLNRSAIHKVHVDVNSRLSALIALTHSSAHAEGMKDQRDGDAKEKSGPNMEPL
jgi:hypothetical protein